MSRESKCPTIEAVDREIEGSFTFLVFHPELESLYEHTIRRDRERYAVRTALLGAFLFNMLLGIDWLTIPDAFWSAVVARLGIATPLILMTAFVISRSPPRQVREGLAGLTTIASVFIVMTLIGMSRSADLVVYQNGDLLIIVFATVVQRLQIRYAAATVAGTLVTHLTMAARLPGMTAQLMVNTSMFFTVASILLLWAVYVLEKEQRRSYLLNVRARLLTDHLDLMSKQDALTGLWNRRQLDMVTTSAWTRSQDQPMPMSVILIDVDHFKIFNDSCGHLKGDECLRLLAACVRGVVEGDANASAVRLGGEEILIFIEGAEMEAATRVAERIRIEIAKAAIPHPALGEGMKVTASLGVATGKAPDHPLNKIVAAADDALYVAKRAGRDRISSVIVSHTTPVVHQRSSSLSPVEQPRLVHATADVYVEA